MTDTTHFSTHELRTPVTRGAPRIAGTALAFTQHRYDQADVARELTTMGGPEFMRFAQTSGVDTRSLALPLQRYPRLTGFTEANSAYLEVAVELGEQAVRSALEAARIAPDEVDVIVSVPTIDARLATRLGLRPDVKRIPLFGLGCVGGAARMARVHDYLRGFPGQVALLLSIELCSLTLQREDTSIPALIGVCLFGDGAAAVVCTGADRVPSHPGVHEDPRIIATRSTLFPGTVDVMGWNVSSSGFQLVMSRDVPRMAEDHLRAEVDDFLAEHGLSAADIDTWICHPGGPKVIEAIIAAMDIPAQALSLSTESMRENGNISSASVLDVLRRTIAQSPAAGTLAVMLAMGPGFSFELLLLSW